MTEQQQNRLDRFLDMVRQQGDIAIAQGFELNVMAFALQGQRLTAHGMEPYSIEFSFEYPDEKEDDNA